MEYLQTSYGRNLPDERKHERSKEQYYNVSNEILPAVLHENTSYWNGYVR